MITRVYTGAIAALEMAVYTPTQCVKDLLDGTDTELLIVDKVSGFAKMLLSELDVEDDPDQTEVELGDWLVRIGDDVFVYEPETFHETFSFE